MLDGHSHCIVCDNVGVVSIANSILQLSGEPQIDIWRHAYGIDQPPHNNNTMKWSFFIPDPNLHLA